MNFIYYVQCCSPVLKMVLGTWSMLNKYWLDLYKNEWINEKINMLNLPLNIFMNLLFVIF